MGSIKIAKIPNETILELTGVSFHPQSVTDLECVLHGSVVADLMFPSLCRLKCIL